MIFSLATRAKQEICIGGSRQQGLSVSSQCPLQIIPHQIYFLDPFNVENFSFHTAKFVFCNANVYFLNLNTRNVRNLSYSFNHEIFNSTKLMQTQPRMGFKTFLWCQRLFGTDCLVCKVGVNIQYCSGYNVAKCAYSNVE